MSDGYTIRTNNVPRDIIDGWELTPAEREEFDFLDWEAIEQGRDSASFFRYRGELYYLGNFLRTDFNGFTDAGPPLRAWDGYESDSFFSGTLVRYADDGERVVVGRYYT